MTILAEFLYYPPWFWLILGGILLASELLGAAGYLLWTGIAAVIVAAISWIFPALSWPWLWICFSALSIIVSIAWWKLNKIYPKKVENKVNQRNSHLIGMRSTVVEDIINGKGRVKVADSSWRATCSEDLKIGATVEVIAIDGITLQVKPVSN